MDERRMARADLVAGAVFLALAATIVAGAWNMDRLAIRQIHPFSAPGVTPGLLGMALGVASLLMVLRAVKSGALTGWGRGQGAEAVWRGPAAMRFAVSLALSLVYAGGLLGRMPYWIATALFVASFIVVFEWGDSERRVARLSWAGAIGVGVGVVVSYVFSELFLVRLP